MLDKLLGAAMLLCGLAALVITYHRHMKAIYADIAAEDAERLAEMRFKEMKRGMQVRVVQRLQIVDEMGRRNSNDTENESLAP